MVLIDLFDYVISFECDDNPLFQEELSLGKKLNTNGDKVDQSGGQGGREPSSINLEQSRADSMTRIQGPIIKGFDFQQDRQDVKSLDLGSTDSSWMEASGIITDSEEEDSHKEVTLKIMQLLMDPNSGGQSVNYLPGRVAMPEVTVVQYLQDEPGRENNHNFESVQCTMG